jgi:Uma2 family endonuclease
MSQTYAKVEEPLTAEEYIAFERAADIKHEYHAGEIIAFAGASRTHIIISGNTHYRLMNQLLDKPCEVYMADMRVRATPTAYVYPDVVVICGEPLFADEEFDILLNPTVIVEVLSPSTEARDRGDKLQYYGSLESVSDYLLIAQDKSRVDHYIKHSSSEWNLRVYAEFSDEIDLASIGCKLVVADIYAKVEFPRKPARLPEA